MAGYVRRFSTLSSALVGAVLIASGVATTVAGSADSSLPPVSTAPAPISALDQCSVLMPSAFQLSNRSLNFATRPDPTLIPLKLSQAGIFGETSTSSDNLGVGFVYFTPGAGVDLAGNSLEKTAPATYGFSNNLQLFAPSNPAQIGGLKLQGQFFLSGGSQANSLANAATQNQQALSQTVSFSSRMVNVSASFLNVGKNFAGGDSLTSALQSSDPTSVDSAKDMLTHIGQNNTNFTLGLGSSSTGTVGFKMASSIDSVAGSSTQDHLLNFNRAFGGGLGLTLSDDQSNLSSTGSSVQTHIESFKLASLALGSTPGIDLEDKIRTDSLGNVDRNLKLGASQNISGYALGVAYGIENAQSGTAPSADIRTVQYSANRTVAQTTVAANWTTTTNSSLTGSQHQIGEGTVSISIAPVRSLTVQTQYASNSGNTTRGMSALYLMPHLIGLINAKLNLSLSTMGGLSSSVATRKVTVDAMTPGQKDALLKMFSGMNVHLEDDQALQSSLSQTTATPARSYTIGLDSSPTDFKAFRWGYKLIEAEPTGSASLPTTARALDVTVPLGESSVGYSSKDQIPQSDGSFANTKLQDIKFATPLPNGNMSLSTDYSAAIDYHDSICRRNSVGVTLSGATGTDQRLNFGLALQSSSVDGIGDDTATTYTFGYHLNHDAQNTLDVNSTVTTHVSTTSTPSPAPIDSTVQMSYKHAF